MNWLSTGVAAWLVSCGVYAAEDASKAEPPAPAGTNDAPPALWFPVGEELHYHVYWSKMLVGRSSIYTSWAQENGRRVLKILYWTRSNRALSRLYPVHDLICVIVDPVTFLPIRFDVDLKEGRYHRKEQTVFDYEKKIATWTSAIKNKTKTFPIEADTRDLVTFMYFMRSQRFRAGERRATKVMADDKIYDLDLKVGNVEKVELERYGKVRCLRVDPTAQFEGLFVRTGRMTLWVSNDKRNLCAKVVAEVPVGTVRAELSKIGGPGDDFWVENSKTNLPSAPDMEE